MSKPLFSHNMENDPLMMQRTSHISRVDYHSSHDEQTFFLVKFKWNADAELPSFRKHDKQEQLWC